jgi:hypothetical protein
MNRYVSPDAAASYTSRSAVPTPADAVRLRSKAEAMREARLEVPRDTSVKPPKPPRGWQWPVVGEPMRVEVVDDDGSEPYWCGATVATVLVDGWFEATITNAVESWADWFTWQVG